MRPVLERLGDVWQCHGFLCSVDFFSFLHVSVEAAPERGSDSPRLSCAGGHVGDGNGNWTPSFGLVS